VSDQAPPPVEYTADDWTPTGSPPPPMLSRYCVDLRIDAAPYRCRTMQIWDAYTRQEAIDLSVGRFIEALDRLRDGERPDWPAIAPEDVVLDGARLFSTSVIPFPTFAWWVDGEAELGMTADSPGTDLSDDNVTAWRELYGKQ
jgi:hypothetical protein